VDGQLVADVVGRADDPISPADVPEWAPVPNRVGG